MNDAYTLRCLTHPLDYFARKTQKAKHQTMITIQQDGKVTPAPDAKTDGTSRKGTATCTLDDLRNLLGPPHHTGSAKDKVTAEWVFQTPRGPAVVRDYWWNKSDEQSIGALDVKAARWLAKALRRMGIPATTKTTEGFGPFCKKPPR